MHLKVIFTTTQMTDDLIRQTVLNELANCKKRSVLIDLTLDRYKIIHRRINIILGVATIGSISAWLIKHNYDWLWAMILFLVEIIRQVEPFFDFKKITEELKSKRLKLGVLLTEYETLFNKLNYDLISISEAIELSQKLNKKQEEAQDFPNNIKVDFKKGHQVKADESVKLYLNKNYQITYSN